MDLSTSECSNGCESGWTMYFDQYSDSADQCNRSFSRAVDEDFRSKGAHVDIDQDNEDLSMVSDASSGRPHHISCTSSPSERRKCKQEKKAKEHNFYLEDTASSPVMSFSKDIPGFSQGLFVTDSKKINSEKATWFSPSLLFREKQLREISWFAGKKIVIKTSKSIFSV